MLKVNTFGALTMESDEDEDEEWTSDVESKVDKEEEDCRKSIILEEVEEDKQETFKTEEVLSQLEKAVLIQLHTNNTKIDSMKQFPEEENIEVEYGTLPPEFPKDAPRGSLGMGISFLGRCYLCGCAGHSVKRCPNKFCQRCNTFGHSYQNCPRRVIISPVKEETRTRLPLITPKNDQFESTYRFK